MPNAIAMLKSDHAIIKRLLRGLAAEEGQSAAAVKRREQMVRELEHQIKAHAQVEEEVFYPAFKAAAEKRRQSTDLFYEAAEEHHLVDMMLPTLKTANPKSHEFEAKVKVLKEMVEHHIKEEEKEMFAQAGSFFSDAQLLELGGMMQERRETVEAMWNNPLLRPVKKLQSMAHKFLPTKAKTAKAGAIAKGMQKRGTKKGSAKKGGAKKSARAS